MQDPSTIQDFSNVHFPQRISLIKNLRYVSFLINDIVLIGSVIILLVWFTNFPVLKIFLFQKLAISQFTSILFILLGISLFFGAKRHIASTKEQNEIQYPWWSTLIPILLASLTSLLSLTSILANNVSLVSALYMPPMVGICFFLIGLALIPPFTRIPHRFHIAQFLIFIVSGLSMFVVFENIFRIISSVIVTAQVNTFFSFSLALTFAFFCFGILLRWSNRGFFGNFTLDSTGSRFSFRILLINLIVAPLISFITLIVYPALSHNIDQILSIVVIFFTFTSSLLIWFNLKLLYQYELEHLFMRESLRAHNIDLTKEGETLRQKMTEIEQEKQHYKSELNIQNGWRNAIDKSG